MSIKVAVCVYNTFLMLLEKRNLLYRVVTAFSKYHHCTVVSSEKLSTKSLVMAQPTILDDSVKPANQHSANRCGKNDCDEPVTKKLKTMEDQRKKKVAMLLVYSGQGYLGMQRNPGFKTIESDLLDALVKSEAVRPDHIEQPGVKMSFQRAARTDKGVSAAGQVVSLKMLIGKHVVGAINSNLPEQIRVLGIKRTTKGFDSKNTCDSRTYSYILPTFAFAPSNTELTEDYRITEDVRQRVAELLQLFVGTHSFHNFTSGKKPNDPSAKRFIIHFTIGEPFERCGIEFVTLTVRGQSFMLHQIRKMIGITIAVMRGMTGVETIQRSWQAEKTDVPKAPGLGLILDRLHYDAYNKKYGQDGVHEKIDWCEYQEQISNFVETHIYPTIYTTEKENKSMMKWLATLPLHNYDGVQAALPLHSYGGIQATTVAPSNSSATADNLDKPLKDDDDVILPS